MSTTIKVNLDQTEGQANIRKRRMSVLCYHALLLIWYLNRNHHFKYHRIRTIITYGLKMMF